MGKGYKIAGLILSILGIIAAPFVFGVGEYFVLIPVIIIVVTGLVLSILGFNKKNDTIGTIALFVSIIAIVLTFTISVLYILLSNVIIIAD